jgi:hypothetical protein
MAICTLFGSPSDFWHTELPSKSVRDYRRLGGALFKMRAFAIATSTPNAAFWPAVTMHVLAALLLSGCAGYGASATGTPVSPRSSLTPDLIAPAPSVDLPILLYHHVRPGSSSTLFVSPEVFDQQLEYLQYYGFHTISFTDLADYFEKGNRCLGAPSSSRSTTVEKISSNMAFRYCRNTTTPRRFTSSPIISIMRTS